MDKYDVFNRQQIISDKALHEFLQEMLFKYNLKKKEVIENANVDMTYGYQIFQGRRSPSREVLLQIAFGFPLTVQETKWLLYYGGVETLYPRIRRDAYLMFALKKKMSLSDVNQYLYDKKQSVLGA
jgi:transcriptional regulator with XRE-family HTH domain